MHSVCPQIRPTAFNRLEASSCLAPLDTQLELSPARNPNFFLFFLFRVRLFVYKNGEMGSVGVRQRGRERGYDSICAVCCPPCLGASCVHLTPNVAWGPWLTDGLSHLLQIQVEDLHKNTHRWTIRSLLGQSTCSLWIFIVLTISLVYVYIYHYE